jgi:glycine/D-amino acid oxidase-like deaminating enzyme
MTDVLPRKNNKHLSSNHGIPDHSLFGHDYKSEPFWHDEASNGLSSDVQLPTAVEVLVIGSGYTGLHTALQTSRAGRSTLVIDAGNPGEGCSTRNGGQISTSIKPSIEQLAKKVGYERAKAIRNEGETALNWIEDFIREESIACDFKRNGRFHAAHTPSQYDIISREADQLRKIEGVEAFSVPRPEQRSELGTDAYHGGVVFPRHASLHAAKYHHSLLQAVLQAGASVVPHCAGMSIKRISDSGDHQFLVRTSKGDIKARDVMIATNGYTSELTPWLQRRIIPIGSYIIATEPVDPKLMDELFPTDRIASDTCRVVYYYRASPDRRRVLFGGRVSADETNPNVSGPQLHEQMCRIFPQLQSSKISHSWAGTVGYTFDTIAHTGKHDGLYYSMGYCGSGVSMASYLGMRAGQKIINDAAGQTAFDNLPFPTKPFYTGKPWFLPSVVSWYRWRDKMEYTNAKTS